MFMNKYWPYFIVLGAIVFVGLVLGFSGSRQTPVLPNAANVTPQVSTQVAGQQNVSPTKETTAGSSVLPLTVSQPVNGAQVTGARITVSGKTAPRAEVFINDIELTAGSNGNFTTSITLDEGDNIITVSANDDQGNSSEQEITVTYNPK